MTKKILVFIGLLFLPSATAIAAEVEYSIHMEDTGACFLDDERKSLAKSCKQCLNDAGDAIFRTFRVVCRDNNSPEFVETEKLLTVSLDCDDVEQAPKSNIWWHEQAKQEIDNKLSILSPDQCDLGGEWPLLSKDNMKKAAMSSAVLLAGVVIAVVSEDDDETEYKIKKKEGNATECRHKNRRLKGGSGAIKFCHNCKNVGGDRVVWKFDVYCNGKRIEKEVIEQEFLCKRSIPDESEQRREIRELAEKELKERSASWDGCEITQ